ncbi:hypothetical protein F5146DRAFT_1130435 [Armillaria mellea]|nr:hypothetical protein F5146DRAFT_1130435 [Armillaria mellea]
MKLNKNPSFAGILSQHMLEEPYPMSLTVQPHRAQCIQVTDGTLICPCPWFNAPLLPSLDQLFSCVNCGHGIHAHVDYDSKIVHHRPANYCATYVQKVCTCTVQLFDHEAIVNVYRSLALSHSPAFIPSSLDSVTSLNANIARPSSDTSALEVTLTLTPIPSINTTPSSASNSMLFPLIPFPFTLMDSWERNATGTMYPRKYNNHLRDVPLGGLKVT